VATAVLIMMGPVATAERPLAAPGAPFSGFRRTAVVPFAARSRRRRLPLPLGTFRVRCRTAVRRIRFVCHQETTARPARREAQTKRCGFRHFPRGRGCA
jgi:hypothetical protein